MRRVSSPAMLSRSRSPLVRTASVRSLRPSRTQAPRLVFWGPSKRKCCEGPDVAYPLACTCRKPGILLPSPGAEGVQQRDVWYRLATYPGYGSCGVYVRRNGSLAPVE